MRVLEASGRLQTDQQRLRQAQPMAGIEHGPQASAREILGNDVGQVVVAPVIDREYVRIVERGGRLRFFAESPQERLVGGEGRVQHLDGYGSAQRRVVRKIDLRRRAGADERPEAVTPAEHPADQLVRRGHGPAGYAVHSRCRRHVGGECAAPDLVIAPWRSTDRRGPDIRIDAATTPPGATRCRNPPSGRQEYDP